MIPVLLPLKMIVFQVLLLLVAIAIEAYVLYHELKLTPKQSIDYSSSINLMATVVGWLLFLNIQFITPENLKLQLINCIFFDQWQQGFVLWVFLSAIVTFFASFFVKLLGLTQLQRFLGDPRAKPPDDSEPPPPLKLGTPQRPSRGYGIPGQGNAILKANAFSYSAISLILFIRLLAQGSLTLPLQ